MGSSIEQIKKRILSKIKPGQAEEKRIREFITRLLRISETISGKDAVITGSLGRGTWLKGDHDIDLFLMFPKSVPKKELEKSGLEYGKKISNELKGSFVIKYAEHPYVRARFNDIYVDIVPCYRIKNGERIVSSVDRSPLHLEYVISKISQKTGNEIRLLKQFCKGIGIYGSDAKTLGVSGYICELLVLKYKSFENVLRGMSSIKPGTVIDIEKQWDGSEESAGKIMKKFKNQPLVLIDPVDMDRNVAASLSCENLIRFSKKSGEFMRNPSHDMFFPKQKRLSAGEISRLKKRETKFFAVVFEKPDIIDDVLYPQLRKTTERLCAVLRHNDFVPVRKHAFVDEKERCCCMVFEMETWNLPEIEKKQGPPVFAVKNSADFLEKYKNPAFGPFVEGSFWFIEKKRNFRLATEAVRHFLRASKERLHEKGVPTYISSKIKKFRILEHEEFWETVKTNRELSSFMYRQYFESM